MEDKYEIKRSGQFGHHEVWKNGEVALTPTNEKMGKEYIAEKSGSLKTKKKSIAKKMKPSKVKREIVRQKTLEDRSKKAGWYVHGHKNLGDVYEA
jgi:hypothetical protein